MEKRCFTLEILTPVRIGERAEPLTRLEFAVLGKQVYVFNEIQLLQAVKKSNVFDEFYHYVTSRNNVSVSDFLHRNRLLSQDWLEKHATRVIPTATGERITSIHTTKVTSVDQEYYIPGSSVKGALRTGLLQYLTRNKQQLLQSCFNGKKINDNPTKSLVSYESRYNSRSDVFRGLKVTDAHGDATGSIRSVIVSKGSSNARDSIPMQVETIDPGSVFRGEVVFDPTIWAKMQRNDLQSVSDVLRAVSDSVKRIAEIEVEYFRKKGLTSVANSIENCLNRGANLRLGWGSGIYSTTMLANLSKNQIAELVRKRYRRSNPNWFPSSRRVITHNGSPATVLGYCRLQVD